MIPPRPGRPRDPAIAWTLLTEGVPLSLLCDLAFPDGPPSREILASEALSDDVRLSHPAGRSTEPPEISITGT